jgi:polyphosphate kinase
MAASVKLYHRIEICFPILDKDLAARVEKESLKYYLDDAITRWELDSEGNYQLIQTSQSISVQEKIIGEIS